MKPHGNLGKKRSPETIAKMRAANLGKKHSPETIEKMRAAKLGKKRSPETIEKMRAAKLGVMLTDAQAADYALYRRKGFSKTETLSALGVSP